MESTLGNTISRLVDVSPVVDILLENATKPELLSTPSAKGYLSHLATLPLTELLQEPVSLQTQSHHLTSSLTSLTHTSYPTFISLHKTTTALTSSLESFSSSLDNLLDSSLPSLEEVTGSWKGRTEAVLRERNKARVVLEQHEKIKDLLDIPVLIDTCVRNGYFGEALSLASHVTTLASSQKSEYPTREKTPSPAILHSVLSEVQHSITHMYFSLLATLYEPNRKLPALWKAVSFLRKMDAFGSGPVTPFSLLPHHKQSHLNDQVQTRTFAEEPSNEEQLALVFLVGRESCLQAVLESTGRDIQRLVKETQSISVEEPSSSQTKHNGKRKGQELDEREKEDLARYLKKYIDTWREGVYDIITQYATIFLERNSSSSEAQNIPQSDEEVSRLHTLLRTYTTRALNTHLFATLKPSLPLLSLPHLPSLLTQLNYCSTAFARLGLDFRPNLLGGTGIFSTAILTIIKRDFSSALEQWKMRIEKARGINNRKNNAGHSSTSASASRVAVVPSELPSKFLILPSLVTSPPTFASKSTSSTGPPHIPPQVLASYPPLAELTNAVLGVFNGLRLVVPRNPEITANGKSNGNGKADSGSKMEVEGVNEILKLLDEIVLRNGGSILLDYFKFTISSFIKNSGMAESEKKREQEKEEKVIVASVRAFVDVFAPFVRRALAEGVYGVRIPEKSGTDWQDTKKRLQELLHELDDGDEEEEEDGEEEDEEDSD